MGVFDSLFGGYSEDRKAKEAFTLKVKDAGKAYIIDSGKYISGPFITDAVVTGTLYVNRRGLFFQAIPATKCIVIYVEDIGSMEIINNKKKCIKVNYKDENGFETLVIEVLNAEGCIKELKRAIEEYRLEEKNNLTEEKQISENVLNVEKADDILSIIERLSALKDKGAITEEEFQLKKKELLNRL